MTIILDGTACSSFKDTDYLIAQGDYDVRSTCPGATAAGKLTIVKNLETVGGGVTSYSFKEGTTFGLPENQIEARTDYLSADDGKRDCRAPLIEKIDDLLFTCRTASGDMECQIRLVRR